MAITIKQTELIPVRRDGQIVSTQVVYGGSGGGAGGAGTTYLAGTNICIGGDSSINVCGTVASASNALALCGCVPSCFLGATACAYDSARLNNCVPADITSNLTSGQVLYYDGTTIRSCTVTSGGGSLDALSDVVIATPATNQILQYNGSTWCNTNTTNITTNVSSGQLLCYNGTTITGVTASTLSVKNSTCLNGQLASYYSVASHTHNCYDGTFCATTLSGGTLCARTCICSGGDINIPLGCYIKLNTNAAMRQTSNLMQFGWIGQGHYFQTGIADPFLGLYKSSALVLGVTTDGNTYIPSTKCFFVGQTTGAEKLDVSGNIKASGCIITPVIKITNGAAAGCVLSSAADGTASWTTPTGGVTTLDGLSDVVISGTPATNQVIQYNGSTWCNTAVCDASTNVTFCNICATGALNMGGSYINCTGNFELRGTGTADSTAVRVFATGGNLYLQNGSGDTTIFRSKTGGQIMCITNAGNLTVANNLLANCLKLNGASTPYITASASATQIYYDLNLYNTLKFTGTDLSTIGSGIINGSGVTLQHNGSAALATLTNGACIYGCGFATDFIGSSDRRLKTDINPINNALGIVDKMQGNYFKFNAENTCNVGFIAQDVLEILPEVVALTDGYYGIKYDKITAVLVEAVKELKKCNSDLQKQIFALEDRFINNV
jgi:hypothetical protein